MGPELIKYYKNLDLSFWEIELNGLQAQKAEIDRTKNKDLANVHSLKLYTFYLQLAEVFCLNILALSYNKLAWLFSDNERFESEIRSLLHENESEKKRFIEYFLDNFVLGLVDTSKIRDYKAKRRKYFSIFIEIMEDRGKDKNLLNAYKHGFRVVSGGSVSLLSDSGEKFSPDFDSTIRYFSKKKTQNNTEDTIIENTISFFDFRVFVKCNFILNMLQNAKIIACADGKETSIDTLFLEGEACEEFDKCYGFMRFKTVLFSIDKIPPIRKSK